LWQLTVRQSGKSGRQALLCVLLLLLLLLPSPAVGGVRTPDRWEVRLSFCPTGALPSGITSLFLSLLFHVAAVSRSLSCSLALAFLLATSFRVFFWTFVLYFVRGGLSVVVVVIVTGVLLPKE
jgi:hypothetical protein